MEIYTFGQDFIQLTGTKEIVEQIKNLENIEIEEEGIFYLTIENKESLYEFINYLNQHLNLSKSKIEKWFEEGEIENIEGPDLYSQLSDEFQSRFYYEIRNYIDSLEFWYHCVNIDRYFPLGKDL